MLKFSPNVIFGNGAFGRKLGLGEVMSMDGALMELVPSIEET